MQSIIGLFRVVIGLILGLLCLAGYICGVVAIWSIFSSDVEFGIREFFWILWAIGSIPVQMYLMKEDGWFQK